MLAVFVVLATSMGADAGAGCVATTRDVEAGEQVSADMLGPVACDIAAPEPRGVRFDRMSRSIVADQALPAGTYLGRLRAPATPMLPKGSKVTLRAISGPAIVERQVTTLQPARSGQRVFVRDEGGNVFAVAVVLPVGEAVAR